MKFLNQFFVDQDSEELLLTESIYIIQQTTSSGNIRYEIADAFIHSTEDGQTHLIF